MKKPVLFIFFLPAFFLFGGCDDSEKDKEKIEKFIEDADTREEVINRLKGRNSSGIPTTIRDRYQGDRDYSVDYDLTQYDGPVCEEIEACKDMCQRLVSSSRRNRCYEKPYRLVEALEDGVVKLLSLFDHKSEVISPAIFYALLDLDRNIISNLIRKDNMSEGDLRFFLAWVAFNRDIARILYDEDRSVLKDAFKTLGQYQKDKSKSSLVAGLNTGLLSEEDTFLYLSADERNEEAFIMAHKIIESSAACSSKDCKLQTYCARTQTNRRRRTSRINLRESCRTPGDTRRYSRSSEICYIHGGTVWSYLFDLIEDEEIRSNDLKDAMIDTEKCNDICGDKKSDLCKAI